MKDPSRRDSWSRRIGPAADAGWTLSGSVIGCLLIGYALGEYFDANPGFDRDRAVCGHRGGTLEPG